jgi:hypothetical protein
MKSVKVAELKANLSTYLRRAVDRARLTGNLDDTVTARKRRELTEFLAMLDLIPVSQGVIDQAKGSFAVNVRAIDAINVSTAVLIAAESSDALEFWTHDERQATAALSRGLSVRGV